MAEKMDEQEINRLLEQMRPYEEIGSPLAIYGFLLLLSLGVSVPLVLLSLLLPPAFAPFAGWSARLMGGPFLASLVLLILILAWLKHRVVGWIATGLALLGWLLWISPVLKSARFPPSTLLVPIIVALPVFLVGLYIVAGFLLPIDEKGGKRSQVFRVLVDYTFRQNRPCYVVTDEPREEDKIAKRIKGTPFNPCSVGPGFIICDCDHAVAVSDGITFKGVQGPGVIFTTFGDQPLRTLDLRPQLRAFTVHGLTQDGIEVKVGCFAPFQIDRGEREPQLGEPFPYDRRAAFKAVHKQEMEHPNTKEEEIKQRAWDELPIIIGRRVMQDILSHYRFDELYSPYDIESEPPRVRIAEEFVDRLTKELQPLGIRLIGGGISNLKPAKDEVLQQRVRSWQADWTRKVMLNQARSRADWLQRIERARAEAQTDLILALGERLAELDRPGAKVTPERIVPQFLRILEELAMRPTLRRYIPQDTAQNVRRLRETFEK
ncbi:MAG TPA: hypothetical protein ENI37_00295 [Chloroflexi bacterium]|nr:hypothetical protein [Chloroflexota bacterium]